MRRLWTIIGVADVGASLRWYHSLLGVTPHAPAHADFGQLIDDDGTVLLSLHEWGAHGHPPLGRPDPAGPGNGLLLFFRVGDFEACLERARTLAGALVEEPHVNASTGTSEFALYDRDGYYVMISALD